MFHHNPFYVSLEHTKKKGKAKAKKKNILKLVSINILSDTKLGKAYYIFTFLYQCIHICHQENCISHCVVFVLL